jgi:hypothetical protein
MVEDKEGIWTRGEVSLGYDNPKASEFDEFYPVSIVNEHFVRKKNILYALAQIPFSKLSVKDREKFKQDVGLKGEKQCTT